MKKSNSLRNIWYSLSPKQRFLIRQVYYMPLDLRDKLLGKRHKYVPPRGFIYTGSPASAEDYLKQGKHQLDLLINTINLKPNNSVLDIGSGIGRTAIALTEYLDKNGMYEGFDVVELGVKWCQSKINKDFKNFNFKYVPIFNDLYNNSKLEANRFTFPYDDAYFDSIFSFSVFTHMQIDEIQNYFHEISRVLKPEGKVFSTFFLYNSTNADYISTKKAFSFPVQKEGYKLMNDQVKSGNIAIHEDKLKNMLKESGLMLCESIDGFWKDDNSSNGSKKIEYQDIIIFKKQ